MRRAGTIGDDLRRCRPPSSAGGSGDQSPVDLGRRCATIRTRAAAIAGWILAHLAVALLVALSVVQAIWTIVDVGDGMAHRHGVFAIGKPATVLLPAGAVIFWGVKAIVAGCYRRQKRAPGPPVLRHTGREDRARTSLLFLWMFAAFFAALGVTAGELAARGIDADGVGSALRMTGRLSLLLFLPAYVGGAIATLFGPRFGLMARHGREFGLAYASAQFVHFALVAWVAGSSHSPFVSRVMPFFAIGVAWTYVLVLSSVDRLRDVFGADLWRILRLLGVEYIMLIFFTDLVLVSNETVLQHPIVYRLFSTLTIGGAFLRLAAAVVRLGPRLKRAIEA